MRAQRWNLLGEWGLLAARLSDSRRCRAVLVWARDDGQWQWSLALPWIWANGGKLLEATDSRISIEGHCDERGTVEYNLAQGCADPFGPAVRKSISFNKKLTMYKGLGFGAVQFHDDDAVPEMNDLSPDQIVKKARAVKKRLDGHGLKAEFVAPRLWEDARTIDGGYTSNSPACRRFESNMLR